MSDPSGLWQWLVSGKPRSAPARRLWVVAGGSAGVGVSAATALLARAAVASGRSVLVVDTRGRLSSYFGDDPAAVGPTVMSVAAATPVHTAQDELSRPRLRLAREVMPRFDVVLVDAGSRLATVRQVWAALSDRDGAHDRLLAVASSDASVATAYALVKVFSTRVAPARIDFLMTGAAAGDATATFARLQSAADRFLRRNVGFLGVLPDEPALRESAPHGALRTAPLRSLQSDAAASELLQRMVALAHPNIVAPTTRPSHFEAHP